MFRWFIAVTFIGGLAAPTVKDDLAAFEKERKSFQEFCEKTKNYVDKLEREFAEKVTKRNELNKQIQEKFYRSYKTRADFERISKEVSAFMALRKSVRDFAAEVGEVERSSDRLAQLKADIIDADLAIYTARECLEWLMRGYDQLGIHVDKNSVDIFELTGDQLSAVSAFRSLGVPVDDLDNLSAEDRGNFIASLKAKLSGPKDVLDMPIPKEVEEFFQRDGNPVNNKLLVSSAFMRSANGASVFAKLAEIKNVNIKDLVFKPTPNKDWKELLESLLGGEQDNLLINHLLELLTENK